MTQDKGFDDSVIDKFLDLGGKDFLRKMIDLFIHNVSQRISEAREGESQGDFDAIKRAGHSLQSSAGNFGASKLIELSKKLEFLAAQEIQDEIPDTLFELGKTFQQIKTNLELEKKRLEL